MANGDENLVPVGKLPIGFEPSQLDDTQYRHFLEQEGLEPKLIEEVIGLSHGSKEARSSSSENAGGGGV